MFLDFSRHTLRMTESCCQCRRVMVHRAITLTLNLFSSHCRGEDVILFILWPRLSASCAGWKCDTFIKIQHASRSFPLLSYRVYKWLLVTVRHNVLSNNINHTQRDLGAPVRFFPSQMISATSWGRKVESLKYLHEFQNITVFAILETGRSTFFRFNEKIILFI